MKCITVCYCPETYLNCRSERHSLSGVLWYQHDLASKWRIHFIAEYLSAEQRNTGDPDAIVCDLLESDLDRFQKSMESTSKLLSSLDLYTPLWTQGLATLCSTCQLNLQPFMDLIFRLKAYFAAITRLNKLQGHTLFGVHAFLLCCFEEGPGHVD